MSDIKCNCPWNPNSHAKDCPVYMQEEITRLQSEKEALEARVAAQFDALTSVAVALKDAGSRTKEMHDFIVAATDGSSEAALLRKQAEAVIEIGYLYGPESTVRRNTQSFAQRLHQQADELEQTNG